MAFRFYKRIKLMPGVRLNVSGSGTSLSVGRRGASVTFSSRGTFLNTGIPGTGIAIRARIDSGVAGSARVPEAFFNQMGSRENDHLIRDIAANGRKNATVTVNELRRLMQDPRLTLHDPVSGRKYSRVQLEAILRRAETEKAVEEAQAKIDQRAKELQIGRAHV
mgnify:FL=1